MKPKHKWIKIGENLYQCEKCGCEVEGYGECILACIQRPIAKKSLVQSSTK